MSNKLKAVSLQITNVLGIEEITIDLSGNITEISGRNGEGKTSCIEALKSVLTSADSGTLLRNGAAHGRAVLILDDGSQIVSAFKQGKSSKRVMFGKDKTALDQSPTRIAGLFNAHSLNPVDFLMAKGKARIDILLAAMPIQLNLSEIKRICGPRHEAHPIAGGDAIGSIESARKGLYDLRTGDNSIAKDAQGTINTLQQSLVNAQPFDEDRFTHCKEAVTKINEELKDRTAQARQNYSVTKNDLEAAISVAANCKTKLKLDYEQKCRDFDNQIKDDQRILVDALANAKQQIKGFEEQSALKASSINTELKLLEAAKKAFEGQEGTRQSIKDMQKKEKDYISAARILTDSIAEIDSYKAGLLANMPIKGLSIEGDRLMLDGILFDRVNNAKRVSVAMKLAELRAGELKLILVDGLVDIMDDETRKEFYNLANESDCQFVVTRVTNDTLKTNVPPMT